MRLSETINILNQREVSVNQSIMAAHEIASLVFNRCQADGRMLAQNAAAWQRTALRSKQFILLSVPLNRLAAPRNNGIYARAITDDPIVVDVNSARIGHTFGGLGPRVIVIDGVDRFYAASARGESRIAAWVGTKAAKYLKLIHADHEMSAQELTDQLMSLLSRKYPNGSNRNTTLSHASAPWIVQLYPFELYCIYSYEGRSYRQKFIMAPDRTVALDGPAEEVVSKFVDKTLASSRQLIQDLQACACELAASDQVETNNLAYVVGKKSKVKKRTRKLAKDSNEYSS
jgi:hypothetical protein